MQVSRPINADVPAAKTKLQDSKSLLLLRQLSFPKTPES
jgi:hypothetical protein